jgi:hypothetical protein
MFKYVFFTLVATCTLACTKSGSPTEVTWTGKVLDAVSERPMAGQEVTLRETYWNGFPNFAYGDTLDRTISDADGRFVFHYTDPDDATWFTVESCHPDYFTGRASLGHKEPPREEVQLDISMKPKAWLKIRVLDVPEYDSDVGVIFADLNSENNLVSLFGYGIMYSTIKPKNGDTTFHAFKPGGEPTSFYYWNFDSMGMVRYEAIFPPFDTTELSFGY